MVLKGRTAVVTGGSSGIGRGVCIEFAREGANVVVADVQAAPKRGKYHEQDTVTPTVEEVEKLGARGLFVQADVADEEEVRQLMKGAAAEFGGVDILVNNAGIFTLGNSEELPVSEWERIIGINLKGVFLTTRHVLPHMRNSRAGRIINTHRCTLSAAAAAPPMRRQRRVSSTSPAIPPWRSPPTTSPSTRSVPDTSKRRSRIT